MGTGGDKQGQVDGGRQKDRTHKRRREKTKKAGDGRTEKVRRTTRWMEKKAREQLTKISNKKQIRGEDGGKDQEAS